MKSTCRAWGTAGALLVATAATCVAIAAETFAAPGAAPALHVPSPDWRDQIIYFAMIDRFDDADPGNDDQGAGEFDPADGAKFSGGDLAGLTRRLDYIRGLGVTALWITPPVRNQWWNATTHYGGYHGYWGTDFKAVDPHFGTLDDYQQLSRALHGAGMRLVQDVVVNHTANYVAYPAGPAPADPAQGVSLLADSTGRTAPTQWPFSLNDPRDRLQRAAGIYHWTPDIVDYADRTQELMFQLSGLDDLNTENPLVRAALRDAYGYWIREVGVDGFRIDTAFYVPPDFFSDFLHADDPQAPGIARVAAQTGRRDFHVFGEGFAVDRPYADAMARKIDGYMRGGARGKQAGQRLLPGMLNFPLYGTLGDVFARGHPTAELAYRIGSMMAVHERPHLMPTFVDNHDVDRFLASGSQAGLKQALLAIMTLPGIPTLYYGTEQGFTSQRAAMFASGHGSVGRDHFDADAPLYLFVQRAVALRRGSPVFSRGNPTVLADNPAAPGAIAYRMDHDGEAALVVFNSADRAALLDNLDTGLAPGTVLQPAFAIEGEPGGHVVGAAGRISLELPPRSGFVWAVAPRVQPVAAPAASITMTAPPGMPVRDEFSVGGAAVGTKRVQLVVDGDLPSAIPVEVGVDGRWRARVDTRDMVDPAVTHSVVAWDADSGVASARHRFTVRRDWTLLAEVGDPVGDDRGPRARYDYPSDPGWRDHRQADLRGMRVWGSGGALKVQLRLREVTALWNPANGFDHVAFTLFVQLPGRDDGATVMPLQNASLPDAMRWQVRVRAHGWSNTTYTAAGASSSSEGTVVAASARIEVDAEADTVTFTVPARALGNPASLSGAKLYVNTWDYDGGYRALTLAAQANSFGGGDGATDPLLMDDMPVVTLSHGGLP